MHLGYTGPDTPAVAGSQSQFTVVTDGLIGTVSRILTLPQRALCVSLGHPKNMLCGGSNLGVDILAMLAINGIVWYGVYKLITRKG